MVYGFNEATCRNLEVASRKEWLLTNGIGGFAMGTVCGANERRYHGYLVAAVNPPADRMLLLAGIDAYVQGDGAEHGICCNQYHGVFFPDGYLALSKCVVATEAVRWDYEVEGMKVAKAITLHPGQNAATIAYQNTGDRPFALILRPLVCHRDYHANFREQQGYPFEMSFELNSTQISHANVPLNLLHHGAQRVPNQGWYYRFEHERELERGLDPIDDLFMPCELRYELKPGEQISLVASVGGGFEPIDPFPLCSGSATKLGEQLAIATKPFFVKTEQRATIMAGYPWFTDWGRDTMISLPGVCLHAGRIEEAKAILRDFGAHRKQGLIPNRFNEDGEEPPYNTVDASLWYANAIYKTLQADWDKKFASEMLEVLDDMIEWHIKGTMFGIHACEDGLLTQGEEGVQLTWMDAKIGDWVVTPRHGKPVEINGLWINMLRIGDWLKENLGKKPQYASLADKAEASFEEKFWHPALGHYLDTVDPDDASLRPNQVIAMALPFAPAKGENAKKALEKVSMQLLTPNGLRTLGPDEPGYIGRFTGDMHDRDSAYHQGTVWPWLIGPYVSALVKLTGDKKEGKRILRLAKQQLDDYGIGGIAEVYDGSEPQQPGGCPWQAWSVAETLRAWREDCDGD